MGNNNGKTKGNIGAKILIALMIVIITISLCLSMYAWAKYTTQENGGAVASVAKWDVTFSKSSTIFTKTYNYVVQDRLAPGTEGSYVMSVNSTNTEVAYKYTIEMSNIQNKPTNLHFYTDAAHQHEISLTDNGTKGIVYNQVQVNLDGTTHKAAASDNVTIYWYWPYQTGEGAEAIVANDIIDTQDGVNARQMSFDVTLTAWQVEPKEPLKIGDTVNYTTSLNGKTLSNWKVFYVDGDYTYLILDDYLPNEDISTTIKSTHNLGTYGTYSIYANNSREDLVNAMTTKANWDSLLTGTINGHAVNETRTANVWAMGTPTVDLWVNSWNAKYPSDTLYTRYVDTEDIDNNNFYATGYAIGDSENPTTTYINLSSKTGYNNTLYFPHHERVDGYKCYAYWLASPSAYNNRNVLLVWFNGGIGSEPHSSGNYTIRPVVCLPSSVVNQ